MWVRISAVGVAAGPGMATSVDKPLLNQYRASFAAGHRAGVRTDRDVSGLLGTAINALCHHVFGVRGVDNLIRVAVEDDNREGSTVSPVPRVFVARVPRRVPSPRMAANAEGRSAADR